MSWILAVTAGICMIIVAGGGIIAFWIWLDGLSDRSSGDTARTVELEARVAELERRLTDTQDIVLSIGEKLERMEGVELSPSGEAPS